MERSVPQVLYFLDKETLNSNTRRVSVLFLVRCGHMIKVHLNYVFSESRMY